MAAINISNIPEISKASFMELSNISFNEYFEIIKPLMFFIIGITIYSLFIFKFYIFVAKRDVLELKLNRYSEAYEGFFEKIVKLFFYIFENLILIPLFIFFWFVVIATALLILSRSSIPNQLLLLSISLVAAIRITSYYNENLSQDLAKLIPFTLLGIYLIDASFFSIEGTLAIAKQIPSLWKISVYYLLFVIILEFILRIIHAIYNFFKGSEQLEED